MNATALYKALVEAGASEQIAERAVEGIVSADTIATKTDIAELEIRLEKGLNLKISTATIIIIGAMALLLKLFQL